MASMLNLTSNLNLSSSSPRFSPDSKNIEDWTQELKTYRSPDFDGYSL